MLAERGEAVDHVLNFQVPDDLLVGILRSSSHPLLKEDSSPLRQAAVSRSNRTRASRFEMHTRMVRHVPSFQVGDEAHAISPPATDGARHWPPHTPSQWPHVPRDHDAAQKQGQSAGHSTLP